MVLVGIAFTINDSDIIEVFIRYNLRYLDKLIILDVGSVDNTLQIIRHLIDEGLPITLRQKTELTLQHTEILNQILRELHKVPEVDHAFFLDTDELLIAHSRESLKQELQSVPTNHCVLAPWITYCPTKDDDWDEHDPVRRITHRRQYEVEQYYKVVVSRSYFADGRLAGGNHNIIGNTGRAAPTVTIDNLHIAHFPVRLESQMLSKILLGSWTLQLITDRKKGDGYHWLQLNQRIRRDMRISHAQLQEIAVNYASPKPVPLIHDPFPVPGEPVLRYSNLINQDLTRRLIGFTDQLVRLHINGET